MNLINPFIFSLGDLSDPNWANVVLLLRNDGTDGSTTFTDNSSYARTVTPVGNAQIDTAQKKFGTASGLFDGTGDYLSIAAANGFDFGTANFTFETWARFNSTTGFQYFFDIGTNGTMARLQNGSVLLVWATGAQVLSATITALVANTWYHIALVRSGNNWNFYVDGVSVASATNSRAAGSSALGLRIGDHGGGGFGVNGWLDEVRITKGVARYTGNFTPPTAAFPDYTAVTSYYHTNGKGNRVGSITVTISGVGFVTPSSGQTELINGSLGNTFYMNGIANSSYMEFNFGSNKVIDEMKWYQSGTQTHGTWKIEGSTNGSTWADIGSTFTLGGATIQTITAISGNLTAYRYYRLTLVTGPVSSGPFLQEIEFKISQ